MKEKNMILLFHHCDCMKLKIESKFHVWKNLSVLADNLKFKIIIGINMLQLWNSFETTNELMTRRSTQFHDPQTSRSAKSFILMRVVKVGFLKYEVKEVTYLIRHSESIYTSRLYGWICQKKFKLYASRGRSRLGLVFSFLAIKARL